MMYLYETHLHTSEGSACGEVPGAAYIDFMKNRGFTGMIVTDHFFNGNCAVDRSLPWRFFRNDVDENVLQRRLMDYASARDCNVTDLHIFNNAEVLMSIGVGGVSLPFPYVISYRELQYSCSLTRRSRPPIDARKAGMEDRKALTEEMRTLLKKIPDGGSK